MTDYRITLERDGQTIGEHIWTHTAIDDDLRHSLYDDERKPAGAEADYLSAICIAVAYLLASDNIAHEILTRLIVPVGAGTTAGIASPLLQPTTGYLN